MHMYNKRKTLFTFFIPQDNCYCSSLNLPLKLIALEIESSETVSAVGVCSNLEFGETDSTCPRFSTICVTGSLSSIP